MRLFFTVLYLSIITALYASLGDQAQADDPKEKFSLDTAEPEQQDVIDPTAVWPQKIIIDSKSAIVMLVWFDMEQPRHTKIKFSEIDHLRKTPLFNDKPAELKMKLRDGRTFLLAIDTKVMKPALLLAAVLAKQLKNDRKNASRIYKKNLQNRPSPHLVVGSIKAKDALLPAAAKLQDQGGKVLRSALGEGLGEDVDKLKSKGQVKKHDVDYIIKQHMSRFRLCYQKELAKDPDLQGKISIRFAINKKGKVAGAKVAQTTMNNAPVERCLVKNIYGLSFRPPKGGKVLINYPFAFSNED